jgi:ribosomal protein L11 methyltransferase
VTENPDSLIAYFPETTDIKLIKGRISLFIDLLEKAGLAPLLSHEQRVIPHQDWNESWKKGFKPLDVGKQFTILPPWEEKREGRINLVIDPGMAFGTGHHETTRSCLVLMGKYAAAKRGEAKKNKNEDFCSRKDAKDAKFSKLLTFFASLAPLREKPFGFDSIDLSKQSFLDLGTGTGVLAIAASRLGYQHVLAIDTDPLAVEATEKNCEVNNVINVEIKLESLSDEIGTFDVIAANLISGVLIDLAAALARHLKPHGIAFLSGILAGQEDEVIEAMKKSGLELIEKYPDDKWVSLVVQKY